MDLGSLISFRLQKSHYEMNCGQNKKLPIKKFSPAFEFRTEVSMLTLDLDTCQIFVRWLYKNNTWTSNLYFCLTNLVDEQTSYLKVKLFISQTSRQKRKQKQLNFDFKNR